MDCGHLAGAAGGEVRMNWSQWGVFGRCRERHRGGKLVEITDITTTGIGWFLAFKVQRTYAQLVLAVHVAEQSADGARCTVCLRS